MIHCGLGSKNVQMGCLLHRINAMKIIALECEGLARVG